LGGRVGGNRQNEMGPVTFGAGECLRQLQPGAGEVLPTRTMKVVCLLARLGLRAEQPFRRTQPV